MTDFDFEKEKLLISMISNSRELFSLVRNFIEPYHFNHKLKDSVYFIKDYYDKYKNVPSSKLVKAETGLELENFERISKDEIEYASTQLETFCRNKEVEKAILESPELISKGDFGEIIHKLEKAIKVGIKKDLGVSFFEDPDETFRVMEDNTVRYSLGFPELDEALTGVRKNKQNGTGISKKKLIIFSAPSGVGKSNTLINVSKNLCLQGLNGAYISLEMGEGDIIQRFGSMLTGLKINSILDDCIQAASITNNIKDSRNPGQFFIKRMSTEGTTSNDIRAYIDLLFQQTGVVLDFIMVDYLDLLDSNRKGITPEQMFLHAKYVSQELRAIGNDYNCIVGTASQLHADAFEAEAITQKHIQGGKSRVNTSDYFIGIIQTDSQLAAGEIVFSIVKSRDNSSRGKNILLGWDKTTLTIYNLNPDLQKKQNTPSRIIEVSKDNRNNLEDPEYQKKLLLEKLLK